MNGWFQCALTSKLHVTSHFPSGSGSGSDSGSLLYKDVFNGLVPALVGGIPSGALFFGVKDFLKSTLKGTGALSKDEVTILSVVLANIPYWVSSGCDSCGA